MTYAHSSKEESRRVRLAIRRVFLEVWDPIGIGDEPNAQDEYDGYIGPVFDVLMTGESDREIEKHLVWAVGRMGMDGSRHSHEDVIAALRAIDLRG